MGYQPAGQPGEFFQVIAEAEFASGVAILDALLGTRNGCESGSGGQSDKVFVFVYGVGRCRFGVWG